MTPAVTESLAAVNALWPWARRWGGVAALYHLLLLAAIIAAFDQPAVSTYELQRRDRLPAPTRFADMLTGSFGDSQSLSA